MSQEPAAAVDPQEAKYRDLLESASDLIQSVSEDGRFQYVNRAWRKTLGYDEIEVQQLTFWDVVHPDSRERLRAVLSRPGKPGEPDRIEAVFVSRNGAEIDVEGSLDRWIEKGRPRVILGIFRDITERKLVDRMKQDFISTISHELRTPLTSIIASLGLLESGRFAGNPERTTELVAVAHRNSKRLLQFINDLLDVQKLAARKMTYRLEGVDVTPLLEEAMRGYQALAESCQIRLCLEPVGGEFRVLADRHRLMQVLSNLLSNAIKFSPAGETVILQAQRHGRHIRLSVVDRGPGIPAEFRAKLFEKFTQADSSPTRQFGGTGLGLSIAKGLVEGMGGKLSLVSRIHRGTTFFVELPFDTEGTKAAARQGASGERAK